MIPNHYYTGELVKSLRRKHGLTQRDLANVLKVNPQYVSNIERGVCAFPAKYYKKVSSLVSKELLLKAAVNDFRTQWLSQV